MTVAVYDKTFYKKTKEYYIPSEAEDAKILFFKNFLIVGISQMRLPQPIRSYSVFLFDKNNDFALDSGFSLKRALSDQDGNGILFLNDRAHDMFTIEDGNLFFPIRNWIGIVTELDWYLQNQDFKMFSIPDLEVGIARPSRLLLEASVLVKFRFQFTNDKDFFYYTDQDLVGLKRGCLDEPLVWSQVKAGHRAQVRSFDNDFVAVEWTSDIAEVVKTINVYGAKEGKEMMTLTYSPSTLIYDVQINSGRMVVVEKTFVGTDLILFDIRSDRILTHSCLDWSFICLGSVLLVDDRIYFDVEQENEIWKNDFFKSAVASQSRSSRIMCAKCWVK